MLLALCVLLFLIDRQAGLPVKNFDGLQTRFVREHGVDLAAAAKSDARLVAGNYWTVWPAMLFINEMRRHTVPASPPILGVAERTWDLTVLLDRMPPTTSVAIPLKERTEAVSFLQGYGFQPLFETTNQAAGWIFMECRNARH